MGTSGLTPITHSMATVRAMLERRIFTIVASALLAGLPAQDSKPSQADKPAARKLSLIGS